MAKAVVTFTIMPEGVDTDLEAVQKTAIEQIVEFTGIDETKTKIEPVGFGLNKLIIMFVMEESLGSPDGLAEQIEEMETVQSCETTDVRRAIG